MTLLIIIVVIVFVCSFLITRVRDQRKGDIALACVLVNGVLSSWIAIQALMGRPLNEGFNGGSVFGEIFIRVDALSAWFILLMNFTMLTGILYARVYLKAYHKRPADFSLHYISYIMSQFAMIGIYCIQHMLFFYAPGR